MTQLRMPANPFQDLQAGGARHLKIEQNKRRYGVESAIGIRTNSIQVGHGFVTIFHIMEVELQARLACSRLQEFGVIRIIINMQDGHEGIGREASSPGAAVRW